MSTDKLGGVPDSSGQSTESQTPGCACRSRKLRWSLILLLVLVLLGGAAVYWALFTRVFNLEVYQTAMQKITADKQVQAVLGQPISTVQWPPPSARVESGETEVRWNIKGPKGIAKAHVLARMMMGKWQTPVLEVLLPDGKKISVQDAGDAEAEAPKFEAPKPGAKKAEENAPPPEINLPTPPGDVPGDK